MATTTIERPPTEPEGGAPPQGSATSMVERLQSLPRRQLLLVGSFVVMIVFFTIKQPDTFLSSGNLQNLVNDLAILGTLAISVTVVLALGEFDLSVPNIAALVSVTLAILVTQAGFGSGAALIAAVVLGLLLALAAGSINGVAVGYGSASPFIVTLAVGSVAAGLELLVQSKIELGATQISRQSIPGPLLELSDTKVFGIELAFFVFLLIAGILTLFMVRSTWGRHLQSIGGNEHAARLAGVPVRRIKVSAFVVAGGLAGAAGIFFTARQGYFTNAFPPYLLPAYAAAFFGAAAVGRRGFSIPATLFGVLYLQVLANGLRVMNEPTWVISVVQGLVLFITVLIARIGVRK